jgi:hypothetical protein
MSRFIFATLASAVLTGAAAAQEVPGRDLLDFPLGVLAEAKALSTQMPGGLWNPAASALSSSARGAFGVAGITTPMEQGVRLEMLGADYRVRPALTASLSFADASVSDIFKTATDPQTLPGGAIPYGTSLLSGGLAWRRDNLRVGAAARYRWAALDSDHSGVVSLDGGAILDGVAHTPVRLAVSTFLLSPSGREAATYLAAADVPIVSRDSTFVLRGGYSIDHTEGRGRDEYAFATTSYHMFDANIGVAQSTAYGNVSRRMRLGLGLRYAAYTVAIGREDGAAGIGASYQFLFTRVVR